MDWLFDLLIELFPLYLIAVLGFVAGRLLKVDTKSITTLAIYIIAPIVFVFTIANLEFTASAIYAPILTFIIASVMAAAIIPTMQLSTRDPKTPFTSAMALGTNNWGYFGLPIAFAVLEPQMLGAYVMIGFGTTLFENTLGVYYISRGTMSPLDSIKNVLKLPSFYAIFIGLFLSFIEFQNPPTGERFFEVFKGAYTVLGMMIIGLGLSTLKRFTIDWSFVATMFGVRFILWPALAVGLVALDQNLGVLGPDYHKPLLLFSIMPMAANNIAFAAQFDMNPGKVSVAVLMTTLFALLYIPTAIYVLGI